MNWQEEDKLEKAATKTNNNSSNNHSSFLSCFMQNSEDEDRGMNQERGGIRRQHHKQPELTILNSIKLENNQMGRFFV